MSAQLARLKAALRYSSGADKRAMIVEIECGFTEPAPPSGADGAGTVPTDDRQNQPGRGPPAVADRGEKGRDRHQPDPERAAVADPEPKPPEALLASVDGAGSSSETKARESGGSGSAVPQRPVEAPTGKPVSHGEAGGSPAPARPCRMAGCTRMLPSDAPWAQRYCLARDYAESVSAFRRRHDAPHLVAIAKGRRHHEGAVRRQASRLDAPSAAEDAEVTEARQKPLGRPRYLLRWDPLIRIGPDRPAPNPRGLMFRDDLAAIADHGSASRFASPAVAQAPQSSIL